MIQWCPNQTISDFLQEKKKAAGFVTVALLDHTLDINHAIMKTYRNDLMVSKLNYIQFPTRDKKGSRICYSGLIILDHALDINHMQ